MKQIRNPFRLRRSETIDSDNTFLKLFEGGVLDVLTEAGLPRTVQPIRSAAGGGKTSLLRLFTPHVLRRAYARRGDNLDLFHRLQSLGAVNDKGPAILGVLLQCGRNYAALQDMKIDRSMQGRLFWGLLNARILLAALRSALALRGLEYPEDLGRLRVTASVGSVIPQDITLPATGEDLCRWATGVEKKICDELDSFGPLKAASLPGSDGLFVLPLLDPQAITVDGECLADRVVIMMDDIHMLTPGQRQELIGRVVEARSTVAIWLAERFEALSPTELLSSGSSEGRDHDQPVAVEWYWRKHHERFEKHVMKLADRRVREASTDSQIDSFRSCLEEDLESSQYEEVFYRAFGEVRARVRKRVDGRSQFRTWLESREALQGSPRELALGWRGLEILIERELGRLQRSLFDDVEPLASEELTLKDDGPLASAAELFLSREYDLPYYYGAERLARLASLNIEQFLGLGAAVFEEAISAELIKSGAQRLPARRQHDLMKRAAQTFWRDIPNRVRNGRELRTLLESIGRFCEWYTYRASAPNDPGVAGTAIRMTDRNLLLNPDRSRVRPEHLRLLDLLGSGLAHNYFVADLDYKCKGDLWMVLNLNRLLCVQFNLPLGYGLYKERRLEQLCQWMDQPFEAPKEDGLPL